MKQVHERLFVTSLKHCITGFDKEDAVVHACKSPCHQTVLDYKGSLKNDHPNYLSLEKENNLYLNMVDPPVPLFMPDSFKTFMEFAKKYYDDGKKLIIHCNLGQSRAPSLALLFMAKHLSAVSNESYDKAKEEFKEIYSGYDPGKGIQIYFDKNWEDIGK